MTNKIEKSFLEKKIEEQAREEFQKEWNDFVNTIINHPIFKRIHITIDGKAYKIANFGVNQGIFNQTQEQNERNNFLNYKEVKEEVIQEKIKDKTNDLLRKIASIEYLFDIGV